MLKTNKLVSLLLVIAMVLSMVCVGIVTAGAVDYTKYCLFGYIDGADYGTGEAEWQNPGEYIFDSTGHLTATFPDVPADKGNYVAVKTVTCDSWYMFNSYVADGTTPATLVNCDDASKPGEKMYVPGGAPVTFTLVDNGNDTFSLSYSTGGEQPGPGGDDPVTPPTPSTGNYVAVIYCEAAGDDDTTRNSEAKFNADGTLTYDFIGDSYVFVRDFNTGVEYPLTTSADVFADGVVTLAPYAGSGEFAKKAVGQGTHTLYVAANDDGTLSLSIDNPIGGGDQPEITEAPEVTEAPETTAPSGKNEVVVNGTSYPVSVGDKFTYYYYMNVSDITADSSAPGKIQNIEGETDYNPSVLKITNFNKVADDEPYEDMFPILYSKGLVTSDLPGDLEFNASALSGMAFNKDTSVVVKVDFEVIGEGSSEINTIIRNGWDMDKVKYAENSVVLKNWKSQQVVTLNQQPTQAPDTQAPDTQAPDTQATQAPDTQATPSGKTAIVVGGKEYAVSVGDEVTYYAYLNVNDVTADASVTDDKGETTSKAGMISNIDAHTDYDSSKLQFIKAVDEYGDVNDQAMFPVIYRAGLTPNYDLDGQILFNASSSNGVRLNTNESVLVKFTFKVVAEGTSEIATKVKVLCDADANLNKLVDNYEKKADFYWLETLDAPEPPIETQPIETQPIETKPIETQPIETQPIETQPIETQPIETQPIETQPIETKPIETQPIETQPIETKPVEVDGLFIRADGVLYPVTQGKEYTYVTYFKADGKIGSVDATTYYDATGLEFKPATDKYGDLEVEAMCPTTGAGTVFNALSGEILYNYSSVGGVRFAEDDSILFTGKFLVTAEKGIYDIDTRIKNIADTDMNKLISNYEVLSDSVVTSDVIIDADTPKDTEPVETQPIETEPVETQPVETKPIETEPVETQPVETQPVETQPVVDENKVYILADGKLYPVEQGEDYTYIAYLTVPGVKIGSVDATTFYNTAGLEFKPAVDKYGDMNVAAMLPVLGETVFNALDGEILYNYSSVGGVRFEQDDDGKDAILFTGTFHVTADKGIYEINTKVKALADTNMNKLIFNYVVADGAEFTFYQVIDGVEPIEIGPSTGDQQETQPVETQPVETQPVETKPVETQPVETQPVETKPVETKPVETQPTDGADETVAPTQGGTTPSPASPGNTATTGNKAPNNTSAVKTGSTESAVAFLTLLIMAAGVVMFARKKRFE